MSTSADPARSIAGRCALITGAASGMGRATAQLFASHGARLGLLDRDELGELSGELAADTLVEPHVVDLSDRTTIAPTIEAIRDRLGPIDILVNNAGVSRPATIEADDYWDSWAATFAVNLEAQVELVRCCHDDLARHGQGRIVNIASTEGLGATPGLSAYTASKHGVIGLTRSLSVELGRRGITVNCVAPGPIRTGMTAGIPDDHKATFARRNVPIGRYGEPEEVAHAVLSLALPASSYINGAVLVVDGGMLAQNV